MSFKIEFKIILVYFPAQPPLLRSILQSIMSESEEEITQLREELGVVEQEAEALRNENEYLQNIQDHYEAGNDGDLKQELAQSQRNARDLQRRNDEQFTRIADLRDDLARKTNEITELRIELRELEMY